jgi:hypothetical protein
MTLGRNGRSSVERGVDSAGGGSPTHPLSLRRIALEFVLALAISVVPLLVTQLARLLLDPARGGGESVGWLGVFMAFAGVFLGGIRLTRLMPGRTGRALVVGLAYLIVALPGVFLLDVTSECRLFMNCL